MKIIRVFPRKTSLTPKDDYAFIGDPPLIRPYADFVHISCAFTWDMKECLRLKDAWGQYYDVKIGGPAFNVNHDTFMPGKYIMPGVTFTSRGCENQCPWCMVSEREGKLYQYLDFAPGHIIQDNNLLQCSYAHISRVFEMLRYQGKPVSFRGGIDARLVTYDFVDLIQTIPVNQIFIGCDTEDAIKPLRKAVKLIGLPRDKIRAFVLLKYKSSETIEQAEDRMMQVWEVGAMPFAQLYQPPDRYIQYSKEWKEFVRKWSRPAIMKSLAKKE